MLHNAIVFLQHYGYQLSVILLIFCLIVKGIENKRLRKELDGYRIADRKKLNNVGGVANV